MTTKSRTIAQSRFEIFIDGQFWGIGTEDSVATLRKQGFVVRIAPQAGTLVLRADAHKRNSRNRAI